MGLLQVETPTICQRIHMPTVEYRVDVLGEAPKGCDGQNARGNYIMGRSFLNDFLPSSPSYWNQICFFSAQQKRMVQMSGDQLTWLFAVFFGDDKLASYMHIGIV